METLGLLFSGLQTCLTGENLLAVSVGAFFGTIVGILPGFGPSAAMALLLPFTFKLHPIAAIIMIAGIYYGAMYGGSTTSILVNMPGEVSSVVTCLDGYKMAQNGLAGPALGICAFGSLIGGTISVVLLMLFSPFLSNIAIQFGPVEYTALMVLGLTMITFLARGSTLKALLMACIGLFLGTFGLDPMTGLPRFSFGTLKLMEGLGIVPILMGLFGISEILINVEQTLRMEVQKEKIKRLLPNLSEWKRSIGPILRGSFLGFWFGALPGCGPAISTFIAYATEKRVSKHPERFGEGMIEGVAGPETANNAAVGGSYVTLLSLGIPPNVVMGLVLGGFIIQGIQPGPLLILQHPDIFWSLVASMYIGNIMLLVLNLPLIGIWVSFLRIPYKYLFPLIAVFCLLGVYSINNEFIDVIIMMIFGAVGYFFRKLEFEPAPLVLALFLGPMVENSLRQSLLISDEGFLIFIYYPI
jgi:putative tricarboxylic transport membrane protein